MKKEDLRIVFMGTPEFAVESLAVLVKNKYRIVGVVTMPDKPAGRGHKIQYSPVKEYALEQNLPLLQPTNLKDLSFIEELKALQADLQIVVAFRMLPEIVWNMPPLGTFNLHSSLLPQYRGAAPINWAIINGEKETGVSTFFLQHEIDTGDLILQESTPIGDAEKVGDVHDRLMFLGANLVKKTVDLILENRVVLIPQKNSIDLKVAPKIFKETCLINWHSTTKDLYNFVRGLSPYPVAWFELIKENKEKINVKLYDSSMEIVSHRHEPGLIFTDQKTFLKISTKDGYLHLLDLQFSGKKRTKVSDLLRGYDFTQMKVFI